MSRAAGLAVLVTPKRGPDDLGSAQSLNPFENYRDPYRLSNDRFLVARGATIEWMDGHGKTDVVYRLPQAVSFLARESQWICTIELLAP